MAIALAQYFAQAGVYYPHSDGMPMAESDFQRKPQIYAIHALDAYFADRPDVYVSGNILMHYEEGNPKTVVVPDVLVVIGSEKRDRESYFVWREPKAPDWVLEVTSASTRTEDQGAKFGIYAFLGVQEYFQFDPTGDYLRPALAGYRLVGRSYEPIDPMIGPDGLISVTSEVLGLEARLEGGRLALYDPRTGEKLLSYAESEQARRQAERERDEAKASSAREVAARVAAEAQLAELAAELRRLKGEG
jgi:Uma2 family endonuclease